jgi:hypothetical protein
LRRITDDFQDKMEDNMARRLLIPLLFAVLLIAGCDSDPSDPVVVTDSFTVTIENVGSGFPVHKSGIVNTPVGASAPAPLFPGDAYEFSFTAAANTTPGSGARFNFATMFVQSNDLYYATAPEGLPLFDASGIPISGDVTAQIALYDAGTEQDEEPGVGLNQVIRQAAVNTGGPGEGTIVRLGDGGSNDGFMYPPNAQIIRVTITPR